MDISLHSYTICQVKRDWENETVKSNQTCRVLGMVSDIGSTDWAKKNIIWITDRPNGSRRHQLM